LVRIRIVMKCDLHLESKFAFEYEMIILGNFGRKTIQIYKFRV
jgi:hypothetical protein